MTVQGADQGDTTTIADTVTAAAEDLEAVATATDEHTSVTEEVVADQGYHSNQVLVDLAALDLRTYIAEPHRGRRRWTRKATARDAVYANRRRIRRARGRALQRQRRDRLERPNAHRYETGGMRRTHLRGHPNILKRLLVHTGAFNLGLLMRTLGVGTPRGLQGRLAAVRTLVVALWTRIVDRGPYGDTSIAGPPSRRLIASSCSLPEHQNEPFSHRLLGKDNPASEIAEAGSLRVAPVDPMTVVTGPSQVVGQLADRRLVLIPVQPDRYPTRSRTPVTTRLTPRAKLVPDGTGASCSNRTPRAQDCREC